MLLVLHASFSHRALEEHSEQGMFLIRTVQLQWGSLKLISHQRDEVPLRGKVSHGVT